MHVIAGLGNPGREYRGTRHNTGFMVLEAISRLTRISVLGFKFQGRVGSGTYQGEKILLLKPRTYMNLSGRSIQSCLKYYKLDPGDLIVIHDDLDLPLGRIRVKAKGGAGGHRGIQSIIESLGATEFVRVRVGIGRPAPEQDPVDYVLTTFNTQEKDDIAEAIETAAQATLAIITAGLTRAMNQYNPHKETPPD